MHRIRDFASLFNICEGSFESPKCNFNPKEELSLGIEAIKEELLRREVTIDITTEGNFPKTVYGN
jgi:hypothetical protein